MLSTGRNIWRGADWADASSLGAHLMAEGMWRAKRTRVARSMQRTRPPKAHRLYSAVYANTNMHAQARPMAGRGRGGFHTLAPEHVV
jgi:hypothetical protein